MMQEQDGTRASAVATVGRATRAKDTQISTEASHKSDRVRADSTSGARQWEKTKTNVKGSGTRSFYSVGEVIASGQMVAVRRFTVRRRFTHLKAA